MIDDSLAVLASVVQMLTDLSIPYFLTGSLASSIRGEFRATHDIDFVVVITAEQGMALAKRAATGFFADEQAIENAIRGQHRFNLIHKETVLKVDFFTKVDQLAREQLQRATEVNIPGTALRVRTLTPEDIILSKLRWYVKGGKVSEQQWRDILGVVAINRTELDLDYLNKWADVLQLKDLLAVALN